MPVSAGSIHGVCLCCGVVATEEGKDMLSCQSERWRRLHAQRGGLGWAVWATSPAAVEYALWKERKKTSCSKKNDAEE